MHIDNLLARFGEITDDRDGYLAHCTAHADSKASLKIFVGDDRKVRMVCRAGCPTEDVISAAGLSWADLFDIEGDAVVVPADPPLPVLGRHVLMLREFVDSTADLPADARDYLWQRFGISEEEARTLGVGFSENADFRFLSTSFRSYPRVTVPLRDFDGTVHGLQGRAIVDCPPEHRWLSLKNPKGRCWGAYGVLRAPGGADGPVIITEGPGDGLTAVAHGYDAVVIRGAGLARNDNLMTELANGLQSRLVLTAGDSDRAGSRFNDALAAGLQLRGVTTATLAIPAGHSDITAWREADPEGFPEAFRARVDGARAAGTADGHRPAVASAPRVNLGQLKADLELVGGTVRHANIAEFVATHCNDLLRYVVGVGWYRWDGCVWSATGDDGAALGAITEASKRLLDLVPDGWALEVAGRMLNGRERGYIVKEMAAQPALRCTVDAFDSKRHLLSFRNGTVDLRTGELMPHDASHMLTQCAPTAYVADARAPRWEQFVSEIFPGQPELQAYFQQLLGLCITGEVRDHLLSVWYGEHGRNGKGATIRTMDAAFGPDIIRQVSMSMYEGNRGSTTHSEQLAALRGARMVVASEGTPGAPMNVARLKKHTGGDRIQMRHLYQKEVSFNPTFTLVLATNDLPEFADGGEPLWARTRAILFGESFAGREDPELEPTIQGPEREGVAAWVVRGAMAYYAAGRLRDIEAVTEATRMHKTSVDPLRDIVGELFLYDDGREVLRSDFNRRLKEWRDDNGDKSARFSPSNVKRRLASNGVYERRGPKGWVYVGVRFPEDRPSARDSDASAEPTDIFGQKAG